jgi:hypothetical protein
MGPLRHKDDYFIMRRTGCRQAIRHNPKPIN